MGRTRRISILLESSQDPLNVHAVLRTAEALGIQDVHLVTPRGQAASIAPGVTQRAHEWLTIRRHDDLDEAISVLRAEGRAIWCADNAADAAPLTGLRLEGPVAVVLGNESEGLSPRARAFADGVFRIDLVGFSGSLNLSVAAGIVLWELRRADVVRPASGDLSPAEAATLRARWWERLLAGRAGATSELEEWLARAGEVRAEAQGAPRVMPVDREQR